MEFKFRFKELLENNEITAKKLGEKLQIDHTSIYLYLQGSIPNIENAVKLANYFNCTLNFLFGIDDYPIDFDFKQTYDANSFFLKYNNLLNIKNKTHYKVSKALSLGNSSYKKWENGSLPKIETLIKIANYFNVSIDYLVGRSDIN